MKDGKSPMTATATKRKHTLLGVDVRCKHNSRETNCSVCDGGLW
jgi:hypothetical protein